MTTDLLSTKKYPLSTPEVSKMLGIKPKDANLASEHTVGGADLPVADLHANSHVETGHTEHAHKAESEHLAVDEKSAGRPYLKIAKAVLPYAAIFVVGLFLYYFFFTGIDFGSWIKSTPAAIAPQETALQQRQRQDLAAYQAWMQGFYYDISDSKVLDPNADNSGNGLSNFQKYLLNLNPKSYDTMGLGISDSQAIAMGIDPLSGEQLSDAQKDTIAKYVDMEVVSNRLALFRLKNPSVVAGAATNTGVNTRNFSSLNSSTNLNSGLGNDLAGVDVNTDIAGRLEIPSLNINVPIIWSKDPKDFDGDLRKGVIHYPGTALPGQIGTTYISGHSSNYVWAKGDFNQVFTHLDKLPNNASFKITVVQKNGKDAIFNYVVTYRKEYLPTDPEQYQNSGKSLVALSTCWPVGTTARRLVVFGELTQTAK